MNRDREQELHRLVEQTRAQLIDFGVKPPNFKMGYGYLLATLHHMLDVVEQTDENNLVVGTVAAASLAQRREAS